jgi:hypothetical protein
MVRRQIRLTEDQCQRLKRRAASLGITFAEAIRRCIMERLADEDRVPNRKIMMQYALKVLGAYSDPEELSTVALHHDRYLSKTYR